MQKKKYELIFPIALLTISLIFLTFFINKNLFLAPIQNQQSTKPILIQNCGETVCQDFTTNDIILNENPLDKDANYWNDLLKNNKEVQEEIKRIQQEADNWANQVQCPAECPSKQFTKSQSTSVTPKDPIQGNCRGKQNFDFNQEGWNLLGNCDFAKADAMDKALKRLKEIFETRCTKACAPEVTITALDIPADCVYSWGRAYITIHVAGEIKCSNKPANNQYILRITIHACVTCQK